MKFINNLIAEGLGINLINSIKGYKVYDYYNLFLSSVNWSRDEVVNFQVKKLNELIKYSYNNSPFYKNRIDAAGFNIENFKYPDQLKNIPKLTREELRVYHKDIISKEFDLSKCSKSSSSGSTGDPLTFYHDKNGIAANRAALLFSKYLGGYKPGDKWVNIWGNPRTIKIDWKKKGNYIKKVIFNEIRFPAYTLNHRIQFDNLLKLIKKSKPLFLHGYTNAIFYFSKYLEEKNEKLSFIKGVFTTAENLHNYQRDNIEKYVGTVYDHYGSSETNGIAAQTQHDNYYSILDPHVYVEFDDVIDSNTNSSKVLVTDLDNRVLPFIRYENGDLAVPLENNKTNELKPNFSKLGSIDGRESDLITLPNGGNLVVPSFFGSRMLKNVEGVKQYQVKKTKDKIVINLIIDELFKMESEKIILTTLNEYIPSEIKYELVFNQEILFSKNGKFKVFIDDSKN